tara:strand:+ start:5653 stop:6015 length:363 start_codon:yes stop_codon:yes gene_type:complete
MKPNIASLINAISLILLGSWSYMSLDSRPITALIPVFIGIVLLVLNPGVKKENKIVAHIAVLLTLLILIGLIKPLMGSIGRENILGIIRVAVMILSTAFALITFIRSFIAVRKAKNLEKQ